MEEWEQYSVAVLKAMFPREEKEIKGTSIRALPNSGLVTGMYSPLFKEISLNISLVKSVVESPEEFAVLLGHEFAHFLLQQDQSSHDVLRGEIEVDQVGVAPLKNGDCHWATVLEKMLRSPFYKPLLDTQSTSINQSRIDKLKASCAR